jgi:TfoX/Sxy family transcriptional regulator of competence genes
MAYNEKLAARIRAALSNRDDVEEKSMFGGLCFMVDGKMCIGVMHDDGMMCRINPDIMDEALERQGATIMEFTGRPMKGYIIVDETGYKTKKDFDYWINACIEFNKFAKASKKKKK